MLAADVEREILGIDDTAQKAQVGGQQRLAVVGYEDPLHVKAYAAVARRIEEVVRPLRGDEQQAAVLDHAFGMEVQPVPGVVEGMGDVVVELLVLLLVDLCLGPGPDRRRRVDLLRGFAAAEQDRHADVVAVGAHDALDLALLEEALGILLQLQGDLGAAGGDLLAHVGDLEAAGAVGLPAPVLRLAGLAAFHGHPVGDHEGGVEADAELADQLEIALLLLQLRQEVAGAGVGDGAQVVDQVGPVHADAVVDDGQGPGLAVGQDLDLEFGIVGDQGGIGDRQVAQPVAGVGGVGDQLAQEDLLVGVERVRDDIEQAADFGLKAEGFLCVFRHVCCLRVFAWRLWDLQVVLPALRCYVCQRDNSYKAAFRGPPDPPRRRAASR